MIVFRSLPTSPLVDINLQGMDQSWNSSQWIDVQQCVRRGSKQTPAFVNCSSSDEELTDDDNDNDAIPQLDGPVDVKSGMCLDGTSREETFSFI